MLGDALRSNDGALEGPSGGDGGRARADRVLVVDPDFDSRVVGCDHWHDDFGRLSHIVECVAGNAWLDAEVDL